MSVYELAKSDIIDFQNRDEWAVNVTLTAPNLTTLETKAFYTNHNINVDLETGMPVNARNIHFSFVKKDLVDNLYPFTDNIGDVALVGHKITYNSKSFSIIEVFPNQTLDLIVVICSENE